VLQQALEDARGTLSSLTAHIFERYEDWSEAT
jgi:hypothetical protein